MLNLYIVHPDGSKRYIEKVTDDDKLLAEFDPESNKIDLLPCINYIGRKIHVYHKYNEGIVNSYYAKLDDVQTDSNGLASIKYIKLEGSDPA